MIRPLTALVGSSTEDPNQQTSELNDVRPHALLVVLCRAKADRPPGVVQGQHRVVSPGDITQTPHVATVFWFNPFPGICGSLAVLAGPEAGLAVWVFLRVA